MRLFSMHDNIASSVQQQQHQQQTLQQHHQLQPPNIALQSHFLPQHPIISKSVSDPLLHSVDLAYAGMISSEPEIMPKTAVTAVLFGYIGSRYHGLQKHDRGPPTIERDLESALIKAGAINYAQVCVCLYFLLMD